MSEYVYTAVKDGVPLAAYIRRYELRSWVRRAKPASDVRYFRVHGDTTVDITSEETDE
ncbi:hypothetical protein ACWEF6_01705 [Amycolatopsis sp. NPDC004772]